jgi:hypothetical protein
MIFEPEYDGVCSWRIGPPPAEYKIYAPSGDHATAAMLESLETSRVS